MAAFWCRLCSQAVGTSLWFDSVADFDAHRTASQLHAVACSANGVQVIREFGQHWAKEKPNETGSNFSLSTDFAFQSWLQNPDEGGQ